MIPHASRLLALLACCLLPWGNSLFPAEEESGTFSIYFRDEKVGYEEFTWQEDERGFSLTVRGGMTKPLPMTIEAMTIRLDRNFIPEYYHFRGEVGGVAQEIVSEIAEGRVENVIRVSGREQVVPAEIRRDALLLPNPVFSSYMVITKQFACGLREPKELSAYIIPQTETPVSLEPDPEADCRLFLQMGATRIELDTDASGRLERLAIPSQSLRVEQD